VSESRQTAEHRRLTPDEAAAPLNVPKSDVAALFQGRLATCSLDQLLRMLTWLGDDVEILIASKQAARILTVWYILGKIDA
jgi:predicted XRE-type DNA-binding protein